VPASGVRDSIGKKGHRILHRSRTRATNSWDTFGTEMGVCPWAATCSSFMVRKRSSKSVSDIGKCPEAVETRGTAFSMDIGSGVHEW
jgi:hypothetical protein